MNYKLRDGKTLTKEDLINTKWKVEYLKYFRKLVDGYNLFIWPLTQSHYFYITNVNPKVGFIIDTDFKFMNFDDYFEEDNEFVGRDFDSKNNIMTECIMEKKGDILEVKEITNVNLVSEENLIDKNCRIKDEAAYIPEEQINKIYPTIKVKGSFMWAVEQMKQGKSVRKKSIFNETWRIKLGINEGENFNEKWHKQIWCGNSNYSITMEDIEAIDWEIFEENVFGDYEITPDKELLFHHLARQDVQDELPIELIDLDNLEKAIKRARELKK